MDNDSSTPKYFRRAGIYQISPKEKRSPASSFTLQLTSSDDVDTVHARGDLFHWALIRDLTLRGTTDTTTLLNNVYPEEIRGESQAALYKWFTVGPLMRTRKESPLEFTAKSGMACFTIHATMVNSGGGQQIAKEVEKGPALAEQMVDFR